MFGYNANQNTYPFWSKNGGLTLGGGAPKTPLAPKDNFNYSPFGADWQFQGGASPTQGYKPLAMNPENTGSLVGGEYSPLAVGAKGSQMIADQKPQETGALGMPLMMGFNMLQKNQNDQLFDHNALLPYLQSMKL